MCGFALIVNHDSAGADKAALERMTSVIRHRGPDDSGIYVDGPVGMGFRRLSILDLSTSGHQPMASEDGRFWLSFNGEIYNFVELRNELQSLGHRFRSSGDTEVLLHAYMAWGGGCLDKLNGMWAFAVYDKQKRTVFGARDRFGVKPLFIYRNGQSTLLASEIKSIRASGHYRGGPNMASTANFLFRGELDTDESTFFHDVQQIQPGTSFVLGIDGRFSSSRYWSLEGIKRESRADAVDQFRSMFTDAVKLRLRSDVPVGVFLSGGMDSTSILCEIASIRKAEGNDLPIKAFSFIDPQFDEWANIQDTIAQTGAELLPLSPPAKLIWDKLPDLLWHHDEPVHSLTAAIGYFLSLAAREAGVSVILNGQGADESLAGYPSYFINYWVSLMRAGRYRKLAEEIREFAESQGGNVKLLALKTLRVLLQAPLRIFPPYRGLARWARARREGRVDYLTRDLRACLPDAPVVYSPADLPEVLKRSMERDPLPIYLRVEDRNSMAHSVEVRLPFLDYRLIRYAFSLGPEQKMRGPWNKRVLREAMHGRIPERVRATIEKKGFPVPVDRWAAEELYGPFYEVIASQACRERGIYNCDAILERLKAHRRGELRIGSEIFALVQTELWLRQAERSPVAEAT